MNADFAADERYLITEPNAFFRRRAQRELAKQYPDLALNGARSTSICHGILKASPRAVRSRIRRQRAACLNDLLLA
jgi:hypothetical protein